MREIKFYWPPLIISLIILIPLICVGCWEVPTLILIMLMGGGDPVSEVRQSATFVVTDYEERPIPLALITFRTNYIDEIYKQSTDPEMMFSYDELPRMDAGRPFFIGRTDDEGQVAVTLETTAIDDRFSGPVREERKIFEYFDFIVTIKTDDFEEDVNAAELKEDSVIEGAHFSIKVIEINEPSYTGD
ncbi:MAG: hypothetical protein CMJ46_04555 [Planctomyces sp.]|nr:hypothetical protein [Planctomyces sp.]